MTQYKKIAIISALDNKIADRKKNSLIEKYGFIDIGRNEQKIDGFDLIIALGGDGMMLHLLHKYEKNPIPFYGINCGTVGFLMNNADEKNLLKTLEETKKTIIHPLRMTAVSTNNQQHNHIAINEVSLLRQVSQAAKIKVTINNKTRLESLACDGILVATAAGSTAYNASLRGPIIPLDSKMLALTPISPFRPRNWHGAILPASAKIEFEILDHKTRPVSATADFIEVRDVKKVLVEEDFSIKFSLLFNSSQSLEERVIKEQFGG